MNEVPSRVLFERMILRMVAEGRGKQVQVQKGEAKERAWPMNSDSQECTKCWKYGRAECTFCEMQWGSQLGVSFTDTRNCTTSANYLVIRVSWVPHIALNLLGLKSIQKGWLERVIRRPMGERLRSELGRFWYDWTPDPWSWIVRIRLLGCSSNTLNVIMLFVFSLYQSERSNSRDEMKCS